MLPSEVRLTKRSKFSWEQYLSARGREPSSFNRGGQDAQIEENSVWFQHSQDFIDLCGDVRYSFWFRVLRSLSLESARDLADRDTRHTKRLRTHTSFTPVSNASIVPLSIQTSTLSFSNGRSLISPTTQVISVFSSFTLFIFSITTSE